MNNFTVGSLKTRLDKYLTGQLKHLSRSRIQREIEAGRVLVNDKKVLEGKFVVRKGDFVKFQIPNSKFQKKEIKPVSLPLRVLYDNHGLLIIDKPAGLTVHPGAGFKGENLASALLFKFKDIKLVGEENRPGIVHRLDKDTSGVILVAKTPEMYEFLKEAFQERKVKKEYIALVKGRVEKPHGFIEIPIGKSKTDFRKHDTKNIIEPKESLTEYKVLEYLSSPSPQSSPLKGEEGKLGIDGYTLLLVKLHTGRTHQIRVHFKSIGHPLMGDALYGGKSSKLGGLSRQFLHAQKIEVQLPEGTWIEAESELPEDLKRVLVILNSKVVKQL
ncbi:MAG: RluA family pseudouridine synthase [Candidatus Doudnabacteria bacterium]|nr:RluA family pseudouridine synthase [Candidatus Doudnabacteria bacterium]